MNADQTDNLAKPRGPHSLVPAARQVLPIPRSPDHVRSPDLIPLR